MAIRNQYDRYQRNPLYDDIRPGTGGRAGGKFVMNDGTSEPQVLGFLLQFDGGLILQLDNARIYRRK